MSRSREIARRVGLASIQAGREGVGRVRSRLPDIRDVVRVGTSMALPAFTAEAAARWPLIKQLDMATISRFPLSLVERLASSHIAHMGPEDLLRLAYIPAAVVVGRAIDWKNAQRFGEQDVHPFFARLRGVARDVQTASIATGGLIINNLVTSNAKTGAPTDWVNILLYAGLIGLPFVENLKSLKDGGESRNHFLHLLKSASVIAFGTAILSHAQDPDTRALGATMVISAIADMSDVAANTHHDRLIREAGSITDSFRKRLPF